MPGVISVPGLAWAKAVAAGKVIFWADSWLVTVLLAELYAHNNKAPAATRTTVNNRPPALTMASNDFLRILGFPFFLDCSVYQS